MKKINYYLIVPSSDIYVKTKECGVVIVDHAETSTIFDRNGIPKELQYVVIKVSLKNNIAKELLSHAIYYTKEPIVRAIASHDDGVILDSNDNVIDTKIALYNVDKVKTFYQSIIDKKLSTNYQNAMKEIYKYHYFKKENEKTRELKRNEYIH